MTTEEILRVINNSSIRTLTEFIDTAQKMFPEITNISIINKQDMGLSGILATARFNLGMDDIVVKGFLYQNDKWTPETHGYVIAKRI